MTNSVQCVALADLGEEQEGVGNYVMKLEVKVHSPNCLYKAAKEHKDGIEATHLRHRNNKVNIPDCLTMLLDPSTLSGCEITSSNAERVDGLTDEYSVEIYVRVFDPQALLVLAQNHPDAQGATEEEGSLSYDGIPDVPACLHMVLDPGTLAGCSIHQGNVEHDCSW